MKKNTFYSLLFMLILVSVSLFSCSTDDVQERQSELCECVIFTTIYEDDSEDTSIISSTSDSILDDCSEDGKIITSVNTEGQLVKNEWACQQQ